jgi:hypothetical protein
VGEGEERFDGSQRPILCKTRVGRSTSLRPVRSSQR